ncbi:MAG: LysR family transcriptional regulator [Ruminococcaceae bacterium]|nr:LysR family transcriptional regulator [Oscillospiraceae bacterium]
MMYSKYKLFKRDVWGILNMNTKHIQYVLALAQTSSFSQAAEQLGISQPALSKQIQHIENELGVKLFDRERSPLALTPAGDYFVRSARELVYKEEQMRKALEGFQSGENGRLVIGITPFRSLYLMPELVKKIRAQYPGVQVSLQEVPASQLRKEAAEGRYDLAIVNLPVDTSLLDTVALEPDTLVLAVHNKMADGLPSNGEEMFPTIDFKDAKHLPFIVLGQGQEMRQVFDGLCAATDVYPTIAAEVNGVTSAWAMARAGVGAALLPLQFVRESYFDDELSLYIIKSNLYSRQPVIATRKGQVLTPYAELVIKLLTEKK